MSADRKAFERATLEAVKAALGEDSRRLLAEGGQTIRNVWMEGSYPDTRLFVAFHQAFEDREYVLHWDIWSEDFHGPRGSEPPEGIATLVFAHVLEH